MIGPADIYDYQIPFVNRRENKQNFLGYLGNSAKTQLETFISTPQDIVFTAATIAGCLLLRKNIAHFAAPISKFLYTTHPAKAITATILADYGFTYGPCNLLRDLGIDYSLNHYPDPGWFHTMCHERPQQIAAIIASEELLYRFSFLGIAPMIIKNSTCIPALTAAQAILFSYVHKNNPEITATDMLSVGVGGYLYGLLFNALRPKIGMSGALATTTLIHMGWDAHCFAREHFNI